MRTNLSILIVALAALSAIPAVADEPPGGAPPQSGTYMPASTQASGDPTEVICKDVKELGSRLQTKKVCMTRQDWDIQEKAAKDSTEQWQRAGAPQRGH
jgi:hypothetical protein